MTTKQHLIADPSNASQVDTWDGGGGEFWVTHAQRFDESLANHHTPFLTAAGIDEYDHVLDIGCGTGQTTRDAARLAAKGFALGVDLSSPMIALARQTTTAEGIGNVEFQQADAQIHPFDAEEFDAVISRTGAMFFGDPVAAFSNLHRALRPDGRLTLLTWQTIADNEWISEFRTAFAAGRQLPVPPPDAPGPFSLAEPDRVRTILGTAGFTDVSLDDLHAPMSFGLDPDGAFEFILGLAGWMLDGLDDAGREAALTALHTSIEQHTTEQGVVYDSATWIVRARKR